MIASLDKLREDVAGLCTSIFQIQITDMERAHDTFQRHPGTNIGDRKLHRHRLRLHAHTINVEGLSTGIFLSVCLI